MTYFMKNIILWFYNTNLSYHDHLDGNNHTIYFHNICDHDLPHFHGLGSLIQMFMRYLNHTLISFVGLLKFNRLILLIWIILLHLFHYYDQDDISWLSYKRGTFDEIFLSELSSCIFGLNIKDFIIWSFSSCSWYAVESKRTSKWADSLKLKHFWFITIINLSYFWSE